MYIFLIAIIYLAFVSLGLPDSLLGSAWPVMRVQMNVPLSYAGIISMIIAGGTIVSSLLSDRVTKKFGVGIITAISVMMTAAALWGFSVSEAFWMLCLWAIPFGLGAGAVDAALNNYVALHYSSRHMNWLHCCWGVGAAISPFIMSFSLISGTGWHGGYRTVSVIQIILTVVLFACLPLWKKTRGLSANAGARPALSLLQIVRIRGVVYVLIAFFCYCALEATTGLWASSFLVSAKGTDPEIAAKYASYFFLGITAGRFLCGFVSEKVGDRNLIRIGVFIILVGIVMFLIPVNLDWLCLYGLIIIGFGCAPVYPAIIHATPNHFGKENSQAIIGVQMASAYAGTTFIPPLFGLLANGIDIGIYPVFLLVLVVMLLFMTERTNKIVYHPLA